MEIGAGICLAFFIGGFIGIGIGIEMNFDWKAFFEYKKEMQEMRLKLATDYLDKEG